MQLSQDDDVSNFHMMEEISIKGDTPGKTPWIVFVIMGIGLFLISRGK